MPPPSPRLLFPARPLARAPLAHALRYCLRAAPAVSFFLQQRPGTFFFVGAALPGELRPHHKSVFDFDEAALPITASVFVHLVRGFTARR